MSRVRSFGVALGSKFLTDELAERRIVEGWKDRPVVIRRIEDAFVDVKWMDDRFGKGRLIPLLFLLEDGQRLSIEIDIGSTEALISLASFRSHCLLPTIAIEHQRTVSARRKG